MMKKMFAIVCVLMLLLAGCGKAPGKTETQPSVSVDLTIPTGAGQAVVPEAGDIVIEITP